MVNQISFSIRHADALDMPCDVLVLKYAQALSGLDATVASALERHGVFVQALLPKPGGFELIPTSGAIAAPSVLFVGLSVFDYVGIRDFAFRALSALAQALPSAARVALAIHGPGYALDESESFRAEMAGLLDALRSGRYPPALEEIIVVARSPGRTQRLSVLLTSILPSRTVGGRDVLGDIVPVATLRALSDAGEGSLSKRHVFVAMPFAREFDDRFHYGIQQAAQNAGFLCERADLASFIGLSLDWIKERIDTASFVIADLTSANPNVYLEVGYAWGRGIPTIFLVSEQDDLKFDVRGHRCLVYSGSIHTLEQLLTKELVALTQRRPHT
jgi:hypothetical protein